MLLLTGVLDVVGFVLVISTSHDASGGIERGFARGEAVVLLALAALNFLAYRVSWINRNTEFQNDIICSPGPHLQRLALRDASVTAFDIPRGLSPAGA